MADLDKETVEFQPNYDERLMEPIGAAVALPEPVVQRVGRHRGRYGDQLAAAQPDARSSAAVRNVLARTRPITLGELCEIDHAGPTSRPAASSWAGAGILQAYSTGRGRVRSCAPSTTSRTIRQRNEQLVFTEIPYQVRKIDDHREDRRRSSSDGRVTGISRRARRVRPRRHPPGRDRAEEGRGPAGHRQPALPVHAAADDAYSIINLVIDRGSAAHADAARAARRLPRPSQGRHPAPHALPAAQGRGAQAHRRGPAHRRRQHRRGDQASSAPKREHRRGEGRAASPPSS